jgi:regulatory protein
MDNTMKSEITPASVRTSAMNLLAMREHSAHELKSKLSKKFDQQEWIDTEVDKLKRDGLQSDERFAEAYINMRLRQGKGALIIRMELRDKGISEQLISEHLSKYQDWDQLALRTYVKKFGCTPVLDVKEKSRRMRFLSSRGFSSSSIQYAIRHGAASEE